MWWGLGCTRGLQWPITLAAARICRLRLSCRSSLVSLSRASNVSLSRVTLSCIKCITLSCIKCITLSCIKCSTLSCIKCITLSCIKCITLSCHSLVPLCMSITVSANIHAPLKRSPKTLLFEDLLPSALPCVCILGTVRSTSIHLRSVHV